MKVLKEYRVKAESKTVKSLSERSLRQKNKKEVVYPDSDGKPFSYFHNIFSF